MTDKSYILAIDQGTSSTKALIFDATASAVARGSSPLDTRYLDNGFVEQNPEDIYQNVLASVSLCMKDFHDNGFSADLISAIGVSNQRETFVIWDSNGKPLHNAVVWQCKRSIEICEELIHKGLSETVRQKTGLMIDPYFSATKLIWLFRNYAEIRLAIKKGDAFFGTIDTWLLYRLTRGKQYRTDHTNASRTLLFNLHTLSWDEDLIDFFGLKGIKLPEVMPSSGPFGQTTLEGIFNNPVRVTALIGDSHASAFGEGLFDAGSAKCTLGTGSSILMNIGNKPLLSTKGMLTTVCWSTDRRVDFAYEGIIVSCGATLEWMRNALALFGDSTETEAMANAVADNGGLYLIPAFSGLGSPHWQMNRKASLTGMSFATTKNHVVRAALESIAYQIKDVIAAMEKEAHISLSRLNADGGISRNAFVMQFIADLLNKQVGRMDIPDISALGAALLAGLHSGIFNSIHQLATMQANRIDYRVVNHASALKAYEGWQKEIQRF